MFYKKNIISAKLKPYQTKNFADIKMQAAGVLQAVDHKCDELVIYN